MSAIVYQRKVTGPAAHALVIGAGHYPHLPGGGGKKFLNTEGMRQLSSPPESARALARWLIEKYESPGRPLASVALLIAEKTPQKFTFRAPGKHEASADVDRATMAAVEPAIIEWRDRGHQNPNNLLLFYFCGHGIASGVDLALLMSDFGEKPLAPLDGALDFRKFYGNMEECAAREQCFFVDACRTNSELLRNNQGYAGRPVLQWTGVPNPDGRLRAGPIFYSSLANAKAYARPGKVSVFTEALLDTLGGAGSGDEMGPWEVKTAKITEALHYLMVEASRALKMAQDQVPSNGGNFAQFSLNTLDVPTVPVIVRVEPPETLKKAVLRCEGQAIHEQRPPKAEPWRFSVTPGIYSFFADFKSGELKAAPYLDQPVHPPIWAKPLKATP